LIRELRVVTRKRDILGVPGPATRRVAEIGHYISEKEVARLTLPHREATAFNTSSNSSWPRNKAEVLRGICPGVISGNFDSSNRMFSIHVESAWTKL
jgi:hypothetical protein